MVVVEGRNLSHTQGKKEEKLSPRHEEAWGSGLLIFMLQDGERPASRSGRFEPWNYLR